MTTYDMIMQNRESLLKYDLDEIEEVACVRDYIIRRLWVIFDQIEDDLVQGAQAGLVPKVLQAVQLLPDSENWFGLHGKDNHIFFMEHMMFLGLSFLKDVLTADKERCTELILSASAGTTEFQDRFLTESLEELREIEHFESEPKFLSIMVHDESFFRDDLDTPSLGWRWINSKKIVYYAGDYAGKGPRDWGYIFWGRERLRASGIFDASSRRIFDYHFEDRHRFLEPCALTRLRDPSITRIPVTFCDTNYDSVTLEECQAAYGHEYFEEERADGNSS